MSATTMFKTVDEYIDSQPKGTKKTLLALRAIIKKAVPDATEPFNYDIPAYALVKDGKRDKQIMIAGCETFAGFYTGRHFGAFVKRASRLQSWKGFRAVPQQSALAQECDC